MALNSACENKGTGRFEESNLDYQLDKETWIDNKVQSWFNAGFGALQNTRPQISTDAGLNF